MYAIRSYYVRAQYIRTIVGEMSRLSDAAQGIAAAFDVGGEQGPAYQFTQQPLGQLVILLRNNFV